MNYIKFSEFFDTYFYWFCPLLTNIGEFFSAHESTIITLFIGILTLYLAFYAIAWAKYEFHITRQSQQVSVFAALCATDDAKRISFAPSLSHMTQKKLPKYPTLMTPFTIILGLFRVQDNEKQLMEYNFDTIDTVSKIIKGFDNWRGANFNFIILIKICNVPFDGLDLSEAHLTKANFSGAHLEGTNLCKAHLEKTNFAGAHLEKTNFLSANLWKAIFDSAHLKGACFTMANLKRASFDNAYLERAFFDNAYLKNAHFTEANLKKASLMKASLMKANLKEANLKEANLEGANLEGANLEGANLEGANLKQVYFYPMINTDNNRTLYEIDNNPIDDHLIQKCVDLLSPAKTLFEATLPKPVEEALREKYPHLFEPPAN